MLCNPLNASLPNVNNNVPYNFAPALMKPTRPSKGTTPSLQTENNAQCCSDQFQTS